MKLRGQIHSGREKLGFSLVEMVVVIAVAFILMAVSAPSLVTAIHNSRLRGAASDLEGIVQMCRSRAVKDSRFYSTYILAANSTGTQPQEAFVDIYPQQVNGASGTGGQSVSNVPGSQDPVAEIPAEVTAQPQASAPSTAALSQLLLPNNPNNLVPTDASVTANPITFGPEGLPCIPYQVTGTGGTGGTVCTTRGAIPGTVTAVAYWIFLQDSNTLGWEAVTVTPAGRVEKWAYLSGTWTKL